MKMIGKSSVLKKIIIVSFCTLGTLVGCQGMNAPHILGNEVPEETINAPRLVSVPPAEANVTWPRLGDVPSKPKDFSPPAVIDQGMMELEDDRTEAEDIRARVEPDLPLLKNGN